MRAERIGKESLAERLRERRGEIEQVTLTRVYSVSGPTEGLETEYLEGLKAAVAAALQYGIDALERSEEHPAPIPTVLRSQARLAARNGVELDTVLRRYLAGHALLDDFLVEESERGGLPRGVSLKRLLRVEAAALDRLLAAVSEEYAREAKARPGSPEQRRAKRIERLLAGELLDTSGLGYDFETHHVGVVATGPGAAEALRELAKQMDCRCLIVKREESTAWAWFGSRRKTIIEELEQRRAERWPAEVALTIGEVSQGLSGWRLSHRQALAALPIAVRGVENVVRYADVALLASILQDDLLVTSLHELYLEPLEWERDGGATSRKILRAYFAAERNVSSAAAALGINRRTVSTRLRMIEERIARPLASCATEIDAALRLEELRSRTTAPSLVGRRE